MTIQKLPALMERIAQADRNFPIAVFRCGKSADLFDGIVASGLRATERIATEAEYIGTFCGHDYSGDIKRMILEAVYDG